MTHEKEKEPEDYWMTGRALKKYLSISESYFRTLIETNNIPLRRIGRAYRFRKSEIDKWMDANPGVKE